VRLDSEDILAKRAIVLGGFPQVTPGTITGKNDVPPPIQMGLTTPAANGHRMRHPSPTIKHGILRQTGGGCSRAPIRGCIVVVEAPPSISVPHQPLPPLPTATLTVANGMYGNGPLLIPLATHLTPLEPQTGPLSGFLVMSVLSAAMRSVAAPFFARTAFASFECYEDAPRATLLCSLPLAVLYWNKH